MAKALKKVGFMLGCLIAFTVAVGLSWIVTCGFIWLICLCFGWTFTWPVATGCWLVGIILAGLFRKSK